MRKKGQFATEYVITIAFAIMVVTTAAFVMYGEFGKQVKEVDMAQLGRFGNSIIDAVSRVSYLGDGSVITITPMLPGGVKNVSVMQNKTLVFSFESDTGASDVLFKSPVNIMVDIGNLNRGVKKIVIRDKSAYTLVCSQDTKLRCNNRCDIYSGENANNTPSDCCTADCHSCTEEKSYATCDYEGEPNCNCIGHNGCTAAAAAIECTVVG
jgi:hypothetical protein